MTWFKLSDDFHTHPKVMCAGNSPVGLWVRCCTWSADQEQDGRVPMEIAHTFGTRRDIERLTATGLWMIEDDHYLVRDFLVYNPSHADLEARRKHEAEKKRRQRERAGRGANGQFMSPGDYPGESPWESR